MFSIPYGTWRFARKVHMKSVYFCIKKQFTGIDDHISHRGIHERLCYSGDVRLCAQTLRTGSNHNILR